jgi:hypothetical protein
MTLSPEGWRTAASEFADMLARIDKLREDEAAKLAANPHAERIEANATMMLFESPPPDGFAAQAEGASAQDEVEDVAPPG